MTSAHHTHHVLICLAHHDSTDRGPLIRACACDEADAIAIAQEQGFAVLRDNEGGCIDTYDAEDGPHVAGYKPDGFGVIIVTVESPQ